MSERNANSAGWIERILLTAGLAALGYCVAIFLYAAVSQVRAQRSLELDIAAASRHDPRDRANQPGPVLGRMEIPRLGFSAMVFEGTSDDVLRRGVGHLANSALPGRPGNVTLTGHRDTFFRPLREVDAQDEIILTTLNGRYYYRVESTKVVAPDDVSVLKSYGEPRLTLITCYPFYFVGAAPKRFIVRAYLLPEAPGPGS